GDGNGLELTVMVYCRGGGITCFVLQETWALLLCCSHINKDEQTHTHTHTPTHTHTHPQPQHTHTHTPPHTQTHTPPHTQTPTHTRSYGTCSSFSSLWGMYYWLGNNLI